MNDMRKLMEMVEASPTATGPQGRLLPNDIDSDLQNGKYKRVPLYKNGKYDGFKLVNVKTGKVKRVTEDSIDIQYPDYDESKYDKEDMWNVYLAGIQVGLESSPSHQDINNAEIKAAFDDVMKHDIDGSVA